MSSVRPSSTDLNGVAFGTVLETAPPEDEFIIRYRETPIGTPIGLYPAISPDKEPSYPIMYGATTPPSVQVPIGFEQLSEQQPGKEQQNGRNTEPTSNDDSEEPLNSLFFDDQTRRIDFVLAFNKEYDDGKNETRRHQFENSLEKFGLELEYAQKAFKKKVIHFVKIHAPWDVLCVYAEFLHMKMPLAKNDINVPESCFDKLYSPFKLDSDIVKEEDNYFTAPFSQERLKQYVIQNTEEFFTSAERSRIVNEILSRATFEGEGRIRKYGIKRLLGNAYIAAYPLHEGPYYYEDSIYATGPRNPRHLLYEMWARPKMWYKKQPLDAIRSYFGEKIGIYFAWLAFYTQMLIPAGFVGVVVFIYGLATMMKDIPSSDICSFDKSGNLTMCPLCDELCRYWKLETVCYYARTSYLIDNPATVFFAAFMSVWSMFFIELWKRQQNEIGYDWDISNFEEEEETVRPEFESTVTTTRENPVTETEEPYVPSCLKIFNYTTSIVVILLMLCLVVGAVVGVIVYRIVIIAVFAKQEHIKEQASIVTSVSASLINLVVILLLNMLYTKLAYCLTELEKHRTQTEWEDGFTLKMFLFQFVNYYSSIFYIAFFKGRIVGSPNNYIYLNNERLEECNPSGCLVELCIQLGVVMVGKQAFNNFVELLLPKLQNWCKVHYNRVKDVEEGDDDDDDDDIDDKESAKRWEVDFLMTEANQLGMFYEYLEMVIQFGFVSIFVAAFPLAPVFALLNNILEVRLDAYKYVTQFRRPLASRAQDIGIWFGILKGICIISVITNALIIAFTSDFIPKMLYKHVISPNHTLEGYVEFSLSYFNVTDFQPRSKPTFESNVTECRYKDFRYPPDSPDKYKHTSTYWHILTIRLAFVIIFQNVVMLLSWLVAALIPDVPYIVKIQMLRESYLTKQALLKFQDEKREKRRTGSIGLKEE
ncbi:anoctamin-4-like isoform X2 [Octopus vulgaris]|uniref:Anoctamin n=1 Tax=Octopus vulgaris TaxID=6645 RepID=A0AA36FFN2_OCTVU|nr:anoctamin-4-like isoform X2 [Octopus vulgaris]